MKKFVSSLRLPLLLLFVLLLSSAAGLSLGKYVGEKPLAQNLTLTVQPREYRLIKGSDFNALTVDGVALKSLAKPIVFDVMKPEYESLIAGLPHVPVAEELTASGTYVRSDQIRLYIGTDAIYVLGDGEIMANVDCNLMFQSFANCTAIRFPNFNTSNVEQMTGMFAGCMMLTDLNVGGFDTTKVKTMSAMFSQCEALTALDLSGFNTSQVQHMNSMFYECKRLGSLTLGSQFDTSKVKNMSTMFYNCAGLQNLDLSGFQTPLLEDMFAMFYGCGELVSLDLSGFTTTGIASLDCLFYECKKLETVNLSSFDTANVSSAVFMFKDCTKLKTITVGSTFTTAGIASGDSYGMFAGCTELVGGAGTSYATAGVTDHSYARIDDPGNNKPGYFTAASRSRSAPLNSGNVNFEGRGIEVNPAS